MGASTLTEQTLNNLGPPTRLIPGDVVAAIAGPLLLAVTNALVALTPGWGEAESTADVIDIVGSHPTRTNVMNLVALAAAALLVPGIWAVSARLRPRTPVLAAVGGWLMATGYIMFVVLSSDSMTALAMAQSGGDTSAYVDAIDAHAPISLVVMYGVFGIGALLGGLILGVAMLRQRDVVPAWAGWGLVASEPVRVAGLMLGLGFGPPLASLLILVAFAGVMLRRFSH